MKKNLLDKIILIIFICVITIEFGLITGFYLLNKMDMNKFKDDVKVNILK